jgi:hypothetical protein
VKATQWKPNIEVHILGAISANYRSGKYWGKTTDRPPYLDGNSRKADVIDGDGDKRAIALSRLQIGGEA